MKIDMSARYEVINADTLKEFKEAVNQKIAHGWKPIGGISTMLVPREDEHGFAFYDYEYYQAMWVEG